MPDTALAMALHATTPEVLRVGGYDALVIGAGAAGGLAALLLAEAGLRVLVLEAGSARLSPDSLVPPGKRRSKSLAAASTDPVSLLRLGVRPAGIRRRPRLPLYNAI